MCLVSRKRSIGSDKETYRTVEKRAFRRLGRVIVGSPSDPLFVVLLFVLFIEWGMAEYKGRKHEEV